MPTFNSNRYKTIKITYILKKTLLDGIVSFFGIDNLFFCIIYVM
jgi:hypothetical protein